MTYTTQKNISIRNILNSTIYFLKMHQVNDPHLEAQLLLSQSLGINRIQLFTHQEKSVSRQDFYKFTLMIRRRISSEPIAYILNSQPFMGLNFYVDKNVLIPRPETEQLVEVTIRKSERLKVAGEKLDILDIGTGSGCIAISLAKALQEAKITATESSPAAIQIARRNAKAHNATERLTFVLGDFLSPIDGGKFDLIISNPPYVPTEDIEKLDPDIKNWEPRTALDGGADGLRYIKQLIQDGPKYLKPSGIVIFEFGINQGPAIKELFPKIEIIKDYSGKDRFACYEQTD